LYYISMLDPDALDRKIAEMGDEYSGKKDRIKDIEKRIKALEEQINDIDVYRKTKPIVDGVPKHFGIDRYMREHESEFILYAAAERSLKKNFGDGKLPLIKELRAEQKELRVEKDKLKGQINDEKPPLDELKTMRKNIDLFMGVDDRAEQRRTKKRSGELE